MSAALLNLRDSYVDYTYLYYNIMYTVFSPTNWITIAKATSVPPRDARAIIFIIRMQLTYEALYSNRRSVDK